MDELTKRRKNRLQAVIDGKPFMGNQSAFAAKVGLSKGRISQLLDPKESFGERSGMKLAEALGLEIRYFEHPAASDVQQETSRPEADLGLGKALEVIAKALTIVDEPTRDSVGHMLHRLALKPEEIGTISRNILTLVGSSPTSVKKSQDGVIDKSLTTGPLDPRNDQRTSVQESARKAQS